MAKKGFEHPSSSKEPEDYDFHKWYVQKYGEPFTERSSRYHEMRRAWKESKKFYENLKTSHNKITVCCPECGDYIFEKDFKKHKCKTG